MYEDVFFSVTTFQPYALKYSTALSLIHTTKHLYIKLFSAPIPVSLIRMKRFMNKSNFKKSVVHY